MVHSDYKAIGSVVTRTIEECSELIKALCKAERFGWWANHPDDPYKIVNLARVENEIDDIRIVTAELSGHLLLLRKARDEEQR